MLSFLIKRGGIGLLIIGVLLVSVSITYAGAGLLADVIRQSDKTIKLELLTSGLTAPNFGTSAPGDEGRLFVSDQDGILWAIDLANGDKSVFADLSGLLVPLGALGQVVSTNAAFWALPFTQVTPVTAFFTPSLQSR